MTKKSIFKNVSKALKDNLITYKDEKFYYLSDLHFIFRTSDEDIYGMILEKVLSYKKHTEPKSIDVTKFNGLFSLPDTGIIAEECEKIAIDKKECLVTSDKWLFNTNYMLVANDHDVKTVIRENERKQYILTQHGEDFDLMVLPIRRK